MKQNNPLKNEIDEAPPSYEEVVADPSISRPIPMTTVYPNTRSNETSTSINLQQRSNAEPRWHVNNVGVVLFRLLIEFLRVPWAAFCFGWVIGTCPILILIFIPCIGIPLTFPVIYSWRMLAIAELVGNKAICKMVACKRRQSFDNDKFKIPELAPSQSSEGDSINRAWARLFDMFTCRILFYYVCIGLSTSIISLLFFIYLLVMICFPISWPFMGDVIRAFDVLQMGLAYVPFVLLTGNTGLAHFINSVH